jgi:hypothetical protein
VQTAEKIEAGKIARDDRPHVRLEAHCGVLDHHAGWDVSGAHCAPPVITSSASTIARARKTSIDSFFI